MIFEETYILYSLLLSSSLVKLIWCSAGSNLAHRSSSQLDASKQTSSYHTFQHLCSIEYLPDIDFNVMLEVQTY